MKYLRFLMILLPLANKGAEPTAKEKFQLALVKSQELSRFIQQEEAKRASLEQEMRSLQVLLDQTSKSIAESKAAQVQGATDLLTLCKQVPAKDLEGFLLNRLKGEWDSADRDVKEAEIELSGFYPLADLGLNQKYTMGGRTYTFRDAQQKQHKAEAARTEIEKQMMQMLGMISKQ